MRSEDLSGIPESIEAWRVGELLEGLGFKPGSYKDVAEILIEPRSVTVHAYATNAEGRRYLVETRSKPAMHTISIPFVGGWEKPICSSKRDLARGDGTTPICDLVAGHAGDHTTGEFRWSNLSGLAAAGVLCESAQMEKIGSAKYRMACGKFEGHEGYHDYTRNTGRVIGDSPQA